jgi:uncharacterized FlaG/YvyC family protein
MSVQLDPAAVSPAAIKQPEPNSPTAPSSSARPVVATAKRQVTSETPKISPLTENQPANVTFRRDPSGRVYYVLSEAQSGKEIRQVPAEVVRRVGEGIDEFLKRQIAEATSVVNVKA